MLKTSKLTARAVLKGVTMAALLSGALAVNAAAEENAKIKSASFLIQPVYQGDEIRVTSSDGKKWDTIDAKALKLSATMKVDTKYPGYVDAYGILLGACFNTGCHNNPVMFYGRSTSRDINHNEVLSFPGNKIPVSTNGIAVPGFGDEILNSCNSQLTSDGATKAYSFSKLLTASFSANTRKGKPPRRVEVSGLPDGEYPDYNGGDVTRQAKFTVRVTCVPKILRSPGASLDEPDDPNYSVKGVKLFLSTFSHATTNPNPGVVCKKGRILARLTTTKTGPVKFKLWTKLGNEPMQSQFVEAWSSQSGSEYKAEFTKWVSVSKTSNLKAMVEDMTNPIGESTGWKDIMLHCTSPGGGGWAPVSNPNDGTGNPPASEQPNKRPQVIVTPKPPKKPAIKVAPVRKTVCIGGKVSRNSCFCPARTKRVKIGANAYRCLVNVVKPQRVVPKAPARRVIKTAPIRRVAPAGRQLRFGRTR